LILTISLRCELHFLFWSFLFISAFLDKFFDLMNPTQEELHKNLHHWYERGVSAAKAADEINKFYGNRVMPDRTARRWFKMFREGRQSVIRMKGQGRPRTVDQRALGQKLRRNSNVTTRKLAENICSKNTAWRYLKRRGKKWRKQREIPHDLTPQQLQKRDELCYRLWRMWRRGQLSLHKIVAHDQSWIFYDGRVCRKQWLSPGEVGDSVPKRDIHGKSKCCAYTGV
jgi:transposase